MSEVITEIARFEVSAQWMHACGKGLEAKTFNVLKIDFYPYAGRRFRRMISVADTFGSWMLQSSGAASWLPRLTVMPRPPKPPRSHSARQYAFGASPYSGWILDDSKGYDTPAAARAEALRICREESYRAIAETRCASMGYGLGYKILF
jgi:hypothetical protein